MDDKLILVVDDNPVCRFFLETFLESLGFSVISATNGSEAVALAVARQPKMIFMDLIMPEMDGFEATMAIHAHPSTAHTPVIAVSANIDDRYAALEAGMIAFIPKPWYESEIQRELRKAWPKSLESVA